MVCNILSGEIRGLRPALLAAKIWMPSFAPLVDFKIERQKLKTGCVHTPSGVSNAPKNEGTPCAASRTCNDCGNSPPSIPLSSPASTQNDVSQFGTFAAELRRRSCRGLPSWNRSRSGFTILATVRACLRGVRNGEKTIQPETTKWIQQWIISQAKIVTCRSILNANVDTIPAGGIRQRPVAQAAGYSAATCSSAASTRTAEYLNSGILP